jgi:protoporphyrinogen/coproporphyrinogen III oxidase
MSTGARQVVVVGGGITGLAAMYYLEKRAREQGVPLQCTLIEASERVGGKIISRTSGDFVVEGGPDSFVTDKPWALELCHELGLADELIPCNTQDNTIYIMRRGELRKFPAGFRLTIPTQVMPFLTSTLISWPGKMRMGLEYFLPAQPAEGDESVGSFIGRRFGREAVELFGGPLMAGIYVSDPYMLSMQSSFPRFLEMERKYGSLIRAARAMKKLPRPPRSGPAPAGHAMFNSLKGGMQQMVDALRGEIRGDIQLNTRLQTLYRMDGVWRLQNSGGEIRADDVVITLPANRTAELVAPWHPALRDALSGIRFVSTATVSLAYLREDLPSDRALDGFGVVIPEGEKRKIIACTRCSTKFKHRAPSDAVLFRAFVGGYRDEGLAEQDEGALVEMVRDEFAAIFGISAEPVLADVYRWPKGNPQYDVGHLDRAEDMMRLAAQFPGLHLAGSSYHGVGMPDCIKSALKAVNAIMPR